MDDPFAWYDACPPHVLDLWIALSAVKNDERNAKGEAMDPDQALQKLSRYHG